MIALGQQNARTRKSTKCTFGLLADEAAHGRGAAPLLPQPCLRAPAQHHARPLRIGLEKSVVAIKPGGALRIAQICPLDEFLRHWIIDRCRKRRRLAELVLLYQPDGLLYDGKIRRQLCWRCRIGRTRRVGRQQDSRSDRALGVLRLSL